jgi:hypothetical protein
MLLVRRWHGGTAAERRAWREMLVERLRNWPGSDQGGGSAEQSEAMNDFDAGGGRFSSRQSIGRSKGRERTAQGPRQGLHWDGPGGRGSGEQQFRDVESPEEYFVGLMEVSAALGGGVWLRVVPLDSEFGGVSANMVRP